MKTTVTVYLQGTMKEYEIDLPLERVARLIESTENFIIPSEKEYIYINKKECSIIEFREVE